MQSVYIVPTGTIVPRAKRGRSPLWTWSERPLSSGRGCRRHSPQGKCRNVPVCECALRAHALRAPEGASWDACPSGTCPLGTCSGPKESIALFGHKFAVANFLPLGRSI
jgi:hypothetical protein